MEYRKWDKEARKKRNKFWSYYFFLKTQVAIHLYAFGLILFERRGTIILRLIADKSGKSAAEKIHSSSSTFVVFLCSVVSPCFENKYIGSHTGVFSKLMALFCRNIVVHYQKWANFSYTIEFTENLIIFARG